MLLVAVRLRGEKTMGLLLLSSMLCLVLVTDCSVNQDAGATSTGTGQQDSRSDNMGGDPTPSARVSEGGGATKGEDDVGSEEVESNQVATDEVNVTSDTGVLHLVVKDLSGRPCLLATLNATIQVSYQVPDVIVHGTYMTMAEIQLPEDVNAKGVCGANTSSIMLDWGNNSTFHVNMTFSRQMDAGHPEDNGTWAMTSLSISYDLSDKKIFPGASESNVETLERHDLDLFSTMEGYTFSCDRDINVRVGSVDRDVDMTFHEVQLAAFGVISEEFPNATIYCTDIPASSQEEEFVVPLIIACCLSAVVVFVVIAYAINRKVQEAKEQSEYRPMP